MKNLDRLEWNPNMGLLHYMNAIESLEISVKNSSDFNVIHDRIKTIYIKKGWTSTPLDLPS